MNDRLRTELSRVASRLGADGIEFVLERPRDAGHGDLATNLAMVLARRDRANPRKTAERVLQELHLPASLVAKTEIAGPGFINFWLADSQLADAHRRILEQGADYGRSSWGAGLKVNVEFVSANPTGPLHVGHGRGAALGDAIASLLEWTGHAVTREFYVNDAGVQIEKLARSLWARVREVAGYMDAAIPEGGYHGEYLLENARQVLASEGRAFADLACWPSGFSGKSRIAISSCSGSGSMSPPPNRLPTTAAGSIAPSPCWPRVASPTNPRGRSGSAPRASATTRTACCARATEA